MSRKPSKGKPGGEETPAPSGVEDLPERWSALVTVKHEAGPHAFNIGELRYPRSRVVVAG